MKVKMKESILCWAATIALGWVTFCLCTIAQHSINAWADNVVISGATVSDNSLPVAKIRAGGTKDNTTYLRGDGYWGEAVGLAGPAGPPGSFENGSTLNINNFPALLRPIRVVDNVLLINCVIDNVYIEGDVVYDKATFKLYRCASDTAWKTFVNGADISDNSVTSAHLTAGIINASSLLADNIITNNMLVGSIAAAKLAVDNLSSVTANMGLLTAGTIQQSYTAPGDDNTTAGAGLKITDGSIEAYGASQTFGGTLLTSDGSYLISAGKYLTDTGKNKKYPLNNGTNFTADGKMHIYLWDSGWKDVVWIGKQTQGSTRANLVVNPRDVTSGSGVMVYNDVGNGYGDNTALFGVWAQNDSTSGWSAAINGVNYGVGTDGYAIGVSGSSQNNIGVYGSGGPYGGRFTGTNGPVLLDPSGSSSAPSHVSAKGTLWVTSAGILYINTGGDNTWQKVGSQ